MKLSRKLIPAMIMLLVSAVLMSTASFAWFSTNTEAKADGFSVQIAAAKNLLIKRTGDTAFANDTYTASVSFTGINGASKTNMNPTSTDHSLISTGNATPTFYSVSEAGSMLPNSHQAASDTQFAVSTDNFVHKTVSINATGEYDLNKVNFGNVAAEVVATDTVTSNDASPVAKSLRVLLVVQQGSTLVGKYLYAPVITAAAAGDDDYTHVAYQPVAGVEKPENSNNDKAAKLGASVTEYANDDTAIITGIQKETEFTVDIYIWFEGQDENCKAINAINIDSYAVEVTFVLVPNTATGAPVTPEEEG